MERIDLHGEWLLQRADSTTTYPMTVPGDNVSALMAAGVIADPYGGREELAAQWIGRTDWLVTRQFTLSETAARMADLFLHFDSIDTVAEVRVNDAPVGASRNMFAGLRFDISKAARPGDNRVSVLLRSPEREAEAESKRLPYPIPHSVFPVQSPHRNLLRKAQCHAGWDWGPCLMVSGIYGSAYVGSSRSHHIERVHTRQLRRTEHRWELEVRVELFCAGPTKTTVNAAVGGATARRDAELAAGEQCVVLTLAVDDPKLWWPAGAGEQPLYDLVVATDEDEVRKRVGFRRIEVISVDDEIGKSMSFRVNGRELFCKGADWIPIDALPSRHTRDVYEQLLQSAVDANMNMIRVWGGGQYELDVFYDLCDEKGILIWQDFMFSCATYPATNEFLAEVRSEVAWQVKRLMDHPSIALWCGNNENVGALNWYPETRKNRDRYLVDYDRLYEGTIGTLVEQLDPERTYWPSSPSGGRNDYTDAWHDDTRGDMHYWSVWHEGKPFDAYYDVTPRFCSEFGFQSFPSLSTVEGYCPPEQLNLTSPVMEHHQRNQRGNSIIIESFSRYFRFPNGFANMLYLSQVQQALAIKTAVEYWRSRRPVCMGALYWQINDMWPVASWASIEYGGKWKLLHYAARRFFEPVHVAAFVKGGRLEVWGHNDEPTAQRGRFALDLVAFDGVTRESRTQEVTLKPDAATPILSIGLSELGVRPDEVFARIALSSDTLQIENDAFLTYPKSCELEDPEITVTVRPAVGPAHTGAPRGRAAVQPWFEVELAAKRPAFYASLDAGDLAGRFDDNCITLLPGKPRVLRFLPFDAADGAPDLESIRRRLALYHLRGSYR